MTKSTSEKIATFHQKTYMSHRFMAQGQTHLDSTDGTAQYAEAPSIHPVEFRNVQSLRTYSVNRLDEIGNYFQVMGK